MKKRFIFTPIPSVRADLLKIHPQNPESRKIEQVINTLKDGGIVIYPTDTIYGIGCDLMNRKAIERLCQIMDIKPQKLDLSFICNDLSHISEYVKRIDTPGVQATEENITRSLHVYTGIEQQGAQDPGCE